MKAPKTQILFLTAAVIFAAAMLRLSWMENPDSAEGCRTAAQTLPCLARSVTAQAVHFMVPGWLALVCGVIALAHSRLWSAGLALMISGIALVFYNTDMGTGGFVLGLISLARSPSHRSVPPVQSPE